MRKICLIGGTGFVGKKLLLRLLAKGWQVKVLTRQPEDHRDLLVLPTVEVASIDVHDQAQLTAALAGCDAVANLVGVLNDDNNGADFRKAHVELPEKIVAACKENKIRRLLHMSALNADKNAKSEYLKTKAEGEKLVHSANSYLKVTSFRPSVIFGDNDGLFNRFRSMMNIFSLPSFLNPFSSNIYALMPLACADAKFAPVWVDDVINAMVVSLEDNAHHGKHYTLCGPETWTLKEVVSYTAELMNIQCKIFPLSDSMAQTMGRVFDKVPGKFKLFSTDNYASLQVDSVSDENDFDKLGIQPSSVKLIMPKVFNSQTPKMAYNTLRLRTGR